MKEIRYNNSASFFKEKFGAKVVKICVDGGFTCPNRDGKCGYGGCCFCGERGAGEHISTKLTITEQIEKGIEKKKHGDSDKFIVYFQNFSNTYADIETLKERYNEVFCNENIVSLGIATRPDCITEEISELIGELNKKLYCFVELGLQTSNDITLRRTNRNHTAMDFTKAVDCLKKESIDVVAHIMAGLPNESFDDFKNTVSFVNKHEIKGVKLHSLYVIENTELAETYKRGEYKPIGREEYIDYVIYALTHLRPDMIIHRLISDYVMGGYLAPEWSNYRVDGRNKLILDIDRKMQKENFYQGCFYKEKE